MKEDLEYIDKLLSSVEVKGDSVLLLANARQRLLKLFQKLEEEDG